MKQIIYCLECKTPFIEYLSKGRKFCNRKCFSLFFKRNPNKGTFKAHPRVKSNCLFCGKEIFSLPNHLYKYCSNKCYNKSQTGQKRNPEIGKKISLTKKGNVIISERQKEQIRKALTGRKLSESTRLKIGLRFKGKPFSGRRATYEEQNTFEARRKKSEAQRGEKNPAWKDGRYPIVMKIRDCFLYKEWHKICRTRDNWTCQICGHHGGIIHIDHYPISFKKMINDIISKYGIENLYEEALKYKPLWNINNGRVLCRNCHKKTDNYGRKFGVRKNAESAIYHLEDLESKV